MGKECIRDEMKHYTDVNKSLYRKWPMREHLTSASSAHYTNIVLYSNNISDIVIFFIAGLHPSDLQSQYLQYPCGGRYPAPSPRRNLSLPWTEERRKPQSRKQSTVD